MKAIILFLSFIPKNGWTSSEHATIQPCWLQMKAGSGNALTNRLTGISQTESKAFCVTTSFIRIAIINSPEFPWCGKESGSVHQLFCQTREFFCTNMTFRWLSIIYYVSKGIFVQKRLTFQFWFVHFGTNLSQKFNHGKNTIRFCYHYGTVLKTFMIVFHF